MATTSATSVIVTNPDTDDMHEKLASAERQLSLQARKCENLIAFFNAQIRDLSEELRGERSWRSTHMEKIQKALMRFESKLKTDQIVIRRQLFEKDGQLNRLYREIIAMRDKYGVSEAEAGNLRIDEVAKYCPACRKDYHKVETRTVSVQVHSRRCMAASTTTNTTDTSSTQSVECLSSSEEGGLTPSFVEARRSKKYMSKRTSGTFRDYLRSRSSDTNSSPTERKSLLSRHPSDVSSFSTSQTYDRRRSANSAGGSLGLVKRANSMCNTSYSSYINEAHGFRRTLPDDLSTSSSSIKQHSPLLSEKENIPEEPDEHNEDDEVFDSVDKRAEQHVPEMVNLAGGKASEFESTDDWYASVSDMEEDSDNALAKPYGYNAVNPVLECVNQILLQQSMDCTLDAESESYETTATSKNKISPSPSTKSPSPPNKVPPAQRSQKRVHFSTQNSMVQVPRSDSFHYDELPISHNSPLSTHKNEPINMDQQQQQQQHFGYESVYSNEYEPIGSEASVATTNLYVDMDTKPDNERIFKILPKQPPALPPKPSNLLKIRNVVRNVTSFNISSPLSLSGDDIDNETEPDYASILEVTQPTVPRRITQEVVVEVHKSDDSESKCNSVFSDNSADESFADVPKLPNVAAIISPKKDFVCPAIISQDNYITRSPVNPKPKSSLPPGILTKNIHNQRVTQSTPSKSQTNAKVNNLPSPNHHQNPALVCPVPVYEDKLQLQAEFDWYNLDVEYSGKPKTDLNEHQLDDRNNGNSVEYKLDEEYIISTTTNSNGLDSDHHFGRSISHEETIIENDRDEDDDHHEVDKILPNNTNGLSCKPVPVPSLIQHPTTPTTHINQSLYMPFEARDSFDSFLKDRGLATKPLPRKRKIFY